MNYLAHAYLSFNQDELLMGNFMGDFIKGNQYTIYPKEIQKGIILHRHIDTFTDNHDIIREAKKIFRADYGLFSGVIIDVLMDYYLANNNIYINESTFEQYTFDIYKTLKKYSYLHTTDMTTMFFYMQKHNWLYHYKTKTGIQKSIEGMVRRYPKLVSATPAMIAFEKHHDQLGDYFNSFFPTLIESCKKKLILL
jgi:acyl carrier protein phosphodiesterase